VGTEAGIQDAQAGSLTHGTCPTSPATNSKNRDRGFNALDDEFMGLGAAFVEEEDAEGVEEDAHRQGKNKILV